MRARDHYLRLACPHVAELPQAFHGFGERYERVIDWTGERFGRSINGCWCAAGLRFYFLHEADRDAFCDAWGATRK